MSASSLRTLVPVILSGGAGTRLWPLSREMAPKAFMRLPDGETLLAKTAARARALPGVADIVTVTNRDLYFHTRDVYASLRGDAVRDTLLLEPFGRNTAPAVALAARIVQDRHGDDAVILAMPADHLIQDQSGFRAAVLRAAALAREGTLVTFGLRPTYPETGFGYLECGSAIDADVAPPAARVARFVEKPSLDKARAYAASASYAWNSGIFCFTASAILAAIARYAPEVDRTTRPIGEALAARVGATMLEIDPERFAGVPDISIDYAVMEPAAAAGSVVAVRGTFDWSDIGSWQAIADLTPPDGDGNRGHGERVAVATRGTFVHSEDRVVATVGIENLVIVDTPDAVLVAHRDHLQRVREVAGELKARGHETYRFHRTVMRPWGLYTVLQEGRGYKIKRIEVKPGASLSLQLHRRRSEHWVVVAGIATVTRGEETFDVGEHGSTHIPVETKHRLENGGATPLVIIEVQCGSYLGEDDIVRFEDRYGRAKEGSP